METGVRTIMTVFLKLIDEYDYQFSITKTGDFIFEKDGRVAVVDVKAYYHKVTKGEVE